MIERTKQLVEDRYNIKNGFQYDSKVEYLFGGFHRTFVYGDVIFQNKKCLLLSFVLFS